MMDREHHAWSFGKLSPGERTWLVAIAFANKQAEKTGKRQRIKGFKMPKGTWVYSVIDDRGGYLLPVKR